MSLSTEKRLQAIDTALERMLTDLNGRSFDVVIFEVGSSRFEDLPETTWLELERRGHLEAMHSFGIPDFD